MPHSAVRRAHQKYKSEGLKSLLRATSRHVGNTPVASYPGLNVISVVQFLFEPTGRYVELTKLYDKQFWVDRYLELVDFYEKPHSSFLGFYLRNGTPNSLYFNKNARRLNKRFFGNKHTTPTPEEMLDGYRAIHFYATNRLMLGYHRYDIGQRYLDILEEGKEVTDCRVLDYGCGVADPALYLGLLGADLDIVDLDTKLFDFAVWRLSQRGLDFGSHRATQTERPVDLGMQSYDFVIMSEFLEHVRDPTPFLELAIDHLEQGGLLYDPVGHDYTHQITEQHLKSTKEVVESDKYQALHKENFTQVEETPFWRKT